MLIKPLRFPSHDSRAWAATGKAFIDDLRFCREGIPHVDIFMEYAIVDPNEGPAETQVLNTQTHDGVKHE